ncbi:MAG: response regulator, partial [Verrucomicrobiota bacterium]
MKKILIIEDDQIVANIYRNKFSVEGYKVEIALDGEVGRELIKSFRPDVIVLDLMLPKITGLELMKEIRAEPDFEKVPVIVFSNTYLTNMVQEAWKAGATKCLSKANCTPKQVLEVVRSALGKNGDTTASSSSSSVSAPPTRIASATPRAAVPASAEVLTTGDSDVEFQADLCKSFLESLPATLATLRLLLQSLAKAESEMVRLKQ